MSDLVTDSQQEVIISTQTNTDKTEAVGIITLNRPRALNALTLDMIKTITQALKIWQDEQSIKAVFIKSSSEKAFCAGGDIKSLYENGQHDPVECMQFFYHEYRLNSLIKHYPKPYIALINGVTMGGGIGVSLHGSHIIASQDLKLAMPESSIGFFTDVGASHFLSRCPDYTGFYLGLTGKSINCTEAHYLRLVDTVLKNSGKKPEDQLEAFSNLITDVVNDDIKNIDAVISHYGINTNNVLSNTSNTIKDKINSIKQCFNANNIQQVFKNLNNHQQESEWAQKTLNLLESKSPTSLLVILELLKRGSELDFNQCMQMEYAVAYGFLTQHDLYEGIRALLIDKDNKPNWDKIDLANCQNFDYQKYFNNQMTDKLEFS